MPSARRSGAVLKTIQEAGHFIWLDEPGQFRESITRLLGR
jgi:pimeloyl-ACP methyl ester carboxylesterase